MKQDRALLVILGVILVLILLSLLVFFLRSEDIGYGSEETPEGVVRNYVLAIHKEEYQRAYNYLNEADEKPTYAQFKQTFIGDRNYIETTGVQIGSTNLIDDEATVQITILHSNSSPYGSTWTENSDAWLILNAGEWNLTFFPYPYWGWDWYTESP